MKHLILIILILFSNSGYCSDEVKLYIGYANDHYETPVNQITQASHDAVENNYFMLTIVLNIDNARMIQIQDLNYLNNICRNDNKGSVVYYSYSDKPLGKRKLTVQVQYDLCLAKSLKSVYYEIANLELLVVGADKKKYYDRVEIKVFSPGRIDKNKKRLLK